MQTESRQLKWRVRLRACPCIILGLMVQAATVFGLSFNVTLASLTNHNTSACADYSPQFGGLVSENFGPTSVVDTSGDTININSNLVDMSLNPVTPGHVSHVDVHTLIPSRPDLRWFANGTCWWGEGPSHHIDNGTTNTTAAYAAAMVADLESRGFNGLIFSWYGKGDQTDTVAQNVQNYLNSASNTNTNFTFIIMVVFGDFVGGETMANVESNIDYCQTQYFGDAHYEKQNGQPLLMFFNVRSSTYFSESDMDTVKAATSSNTLWVDENTTHISESWVNMTYQWTDDYEEANTNFLDSSTPYNLNTVTNDYATIQSYSGKPAFGAMCAHFNGTLTKSAAWSLGKYLPSGNGLCEYYRAQEINQVIPTNMTRMQWATWSDYEEGTEIEVGTENYFGLTTSLISSNTLAWNIISGDERTIDHYEIYAVTNGGNAAFLGSVTNGIHQANLAELGLVPGNYQLYVDAIGLPCIRDHLSTAVAYTGAPPTLPPPWIGQDIGSPGVAGSAGYTNGTFTVSGSGVDIWGTSDSFQFVYQPWNGDGQIVARVVSMQDTASSAKAGLMFRETLAPGSAQGDLFVTPTSGISLQGRTVANAITSKVSTTTNLIAPYWLSFIRTGNVLSGYESPDGVNWTLVGTNVYTMANNIYIGLCVTSKSNVVLNTALFDNISVGASTVVGTPVPIVSTTNYTANLKITFGGYNRPETLNDFPALVRLGANVPGFSYSQFASPAGSDLRFTSSGSAAELPYEVNQWNTNGISTVWVRVPALSGTNDAIVAYWGNPGATNAPDYTTNGEVWAPGGSAAPFDIVYHLEQNGFPYFDSTLQYPSTNGAAPAFTNGMIGAGDYFSRAPYLDAGTVDLGDAFTLSAWVNVSAGVSDIQCIWANGPGVSASDEVFFYVNDYKTSDGALILATGNGTTAGNLVAPAGSVSLNQWHLATAAVNRADGVAQLYVDGNLVAAGAVRNDFASNNDLELGRDTGGSFAFLGSLDEARINSSLESSNWVWASYMTVAANSVFENYSAVSYPVVRLNIQNSGGNVILTWPEGILQSASQVAGPYGDVPGATSPCTNPVSGTPQFFRVKVQ